MTGFTPETEACLACHPSQKDVEPMTDKAVDEAVERVRELIVCIRSNAEENNAHLNDKWVTTIHAHTTVLLEDLLPDLQALLSALELGRHLAKDALPGGETHPSRPYRTDPLKLAGRLERYAAAIEHDFSKSDLWADLICARDALKDSALSPTTPQGEES